MDDIELLAIRCQLGERGGFDALVEGWHEPLWLYVRRAIGDEARAEEILQDVWLRILRSIDRLREPSRLVPWMFSIARRSVMDVLRREYAVPSTSTIEDDVAIPFEEPQWEDVGLLDEALARLPPPERETVALFYIRELDLTEVAAILEIPVGTVKSRLHRARRLLRDDLTAKGMRR